MSGRHDGIGQQLDVAVGAIENGKTKANYGDLAFFENSVFRFVEAAATLVAGELQEHTNTARGSWTVNKMGTTAAAHHANAAGWAMAAATTTNKGFWVHVAGFTTSKSPSIASATTFAAGKVGIPDTGTAGRVKTGTGDADIMEVVVAYAAEASNLITFYKAIIPY